MYHRHRKTNISAPVEGTVVQFPLMWDTLPPERPIRGRSSPLRRLGQTLGFWLELAVSLATVGLCAACALALFVL